MHWDAGLEIRPIRPDEHGELYEAFAEVVASGEGFPHDPAVPLSVEDFRSYWLEHTSLVAVARADGRFAGAYYLKPNLVGRGAHIANAGYFVVPQLRGAGIGERLVRHSLDAAPAYGFDALQFNAVFAANPARRLYDRLGFQLIGTIPEAIDGQDIVIYWRRL